MAETQAGDPDSAVAREIRGVMGKEDLNHGQLARRLGVDRSWVSRRLRGQTPITVNDLAAIAGALGVTVAELTAPVDENLPQTAPDGP